jgi:hypothetical protein
MSIYQYKAGIGNAASYQASGQPFVTGSDTLNGVMKIEFPLCDQRKLSFFGQDGKTNRCLLSHEARHHSINILRLKRQ